MSAGTKPAAGDRISIEIACDARKMAKAMVDLCRGLDRIVSRAVEGTADMTFQLQGGRIRREVRTKQDGVSRVHKVRDFSDWRPR